MAIETEIKSLECVQYFTFIIDRLLFVFEIKEKLTQMNPNIVTGANRCAGIFFGRH